MDKKIGNFLIIYLMSMSVLKAADIALNVFDQYGQPTQQVAVGVPFILEVAVEGDDAVGTPTIERLDQFHVDDQGLVSTIKTMINGRGSSKKMYRYVVRSEKKGSIVVGPAHVQNKQGARVRSASVTIQVTNQVAAQRSQEAAVVLMVSDQDIVVGQKIDLALRFYYQNGVSLLGISEPQIRGATALTGPYSGTEKIDGVPMNYLEWRTQFCPSQPGILSIPSVRAAYKIQRSSQRGAAFDMIATFFEGAFEQKYVYSQALALRIEPLPPFEKEVHAVGLLKSARMSLDRQRASQGDGVVMRLSLEGKGNIATLPAPQLSLPEGLTWYESNQTVTPGPLDTEVKTFEYIVQGLKPGAYTIPSHQIYYYDCDQKRYHAVSTQPLSLVVEALAQHSTPHEETSEQALQQDSISDDIKNISTSFNAGKESPLVPYVSTDDSSYWSLSWRLFFCLLGMLSVGAVLIGRAPYWYALWKKSLPAKNSRNAFKYAQKNLKKITHEKKVEELYHLFMVLYAQRKAKSVYEVDEQMLLHCIQAHATPDVAQSWQDFFTQCAQARFFPETVSDSSKQHLLRQADQWLIRLKEYM